MSFYNAVHSYRSERVRGGVSIYIRNINLQKLFLFKWLSSYVYNREQHAYASGCLYFKVKISCGLPQCSILGLLCLIYISDLAAVSSSFHPILFADDTNMILRHKNYDSLINEDNSGLSVLYECFTANKLSLNVKK